MASRSSGRTGDRPCARGRAVNDALPDLFLRGGGALAQDKAIGVEGGVGRNAQNGFHQSPNARSTRRKNAARRGAFEKFMS